LHAPVYIAFTAVADKWKLSTGTREYLRKSREAGLNAVAQL